MINVDSYSGKYFGEYKVEKVLGTGTYGAVFLASQHTTGQFVAIKLLTNFQQYQDKFLDEVRFLLLLRHEYVLPILGFDLQSRYIVMEYAPRGSLQDRIAYKAPLSTALGVIRQIGLALHYAHTKFIVHRDLKPANILFNARDEALLADLGIALVLEGGKTALVSTVEGTCAYMAPEQFIGEVSVKSDQYALGCIAYELVAGKKAINPVIPFNASDQAKFDIWKNAHTKTIPASLCTFNTDLPGYIERAIFKALAKDRKDRYDDIYAFLVALKLIQTEPLPESETLKAAAQFRNEGNIKYRSKLYSEALTAYENSLQLDPDSADAYHLKGHVLRELKRYIEALHAYTQAIEIDPRDIFYNSMGNVLCDMKSYDEAVKVYQKAIDIAPSKEIYYINKGDALSGLRDYKGALYVYEEAVRRSANNLIKARAFARKAEMLFKLGNRVEAFKTFEAAIACNPSDISLYLAKGQAYWKSKQVDEARRTYEEGLKRDPKNEDLLDRLRPLK